MDAQTQLVAELYKTLNDAQKQEVCNMIDTLLSQQLNDQKSLDSHSAATENQDKGHLQKVVFLDTCAAFHCPRPPQGLLPREAFNRRPKSQNVRLACLYRCCNFACSLILCVKCFRLHIFSSYGKIKIDKSDSPQETLSPFGEGLFYNRK